MKKDQQFLDSINKQLLLNMPFFLIQVPVKNLTSPRIQLTWTTLWGGHLCMYTEMHVIYINTHIYYCTVPQERNEHWRCAHEVSAGSSRDSQPASVWQCPTLSQVSIATTSQWEKKQQRKTLYIHVLYVLNSDLLMQKKEAKQKRTDLITVDHKPEFGWWSQLGTCKPSPGPNS